MYNDITGIILSGGKSKRMKINKSLLRIGGKTIIERTAELMKALFNRVLIITNTPDEYKFVGLETFEDDYKNIGPLAGIHSGLTNSRTEKNFIISCDMPFITEEVISFIIEYKTDKLITITSADGIIQSLCGVYLKAVLPQIENTIEAEINAAGNDQEKKNRELSVLKLIDQTPAEIIPAEKEYTNYQEDLFFNVNTPEDLEILKSITIKGFI